MAGRNKKLSDILPGKWNVLGEKLETGETPEERIRHEIWEE
jgi:hypothetical protein